MLDDLARIAILMTGGFWSFRRLLMRYEAGSAPRRVLQRIYYAYLHGYGAHIGHTAHFESEPCLPHNLHGIFVAGGARIGRGCVVFHQVTIGANSLPDSKGVGSPTVGDNVYIGAGAKIIGNVRVGDNCRIGANCVVTRDVPANSVVTVARTETVTLEEPFDNRYYRWSPEGPVFFDSGRWVLANKPDVVEKLKKAL